MTALQMMITDAGLDAIVNAQNGGTDEVLIESIGLSDTPFVMAPTLDAVPGEFRRLDTVSGQAVAENIIHVVAYDPETITYDVTGFGLFDADGTLIAVYSAEADPILSKAALATSLFAVDIVLASEIADVIEFGDALFLNPPATETVMGVAELATNAEADAGLDDERIMTPKKVKRVLDAAVTLINGSIAVLSAVVDGISNALTALLARTITGGGLATGGGDLTASRVITVTKATGAEVTTGTNDAKAITPLAFATAMGGRSMGVPGYVTLFGFIIQWGNYSVAANGTASPSFPTSFPSACVFAGITGGRDDTAAQDNNPHVNGKSTSGFSIFNATDTGPISGSWIAFGY
jgi:hypothetical protein